MLLVMWDIFQIILGISLIFVITIQSRGTGLGSAWGGGGQSFHTKRGFERVIFATTVALAVIFVTSSFLSAIR